MKTPTRRLLLPLSILVVLAPVSAQARDKISTVIPDDALAFAVIHNTADACQSVGELAKLVHAPVPDLLPIVKNMLPKGFDEQGDFGVVLTSVDPPAKHFVIVPVANFADFFAALGAKEPASGAVDVQFMGHPAVVGRKGNFAVATLAGQKDALEAFLAAKSDITSDAGLMTWLNTNKVSVVVTANGVKQLLPKAIDGIRSFQQHMLQAGIPNAKTAADAFGMYIDLFTAAQNEVSQLAFGIRIDSAQTLDFASRLQFTPGGAWANWAAEVKPATGDLFAGLPAGPFVMAIGNAASDTSMRDLMKLSVKMMRNQSAFNLTPEQAQKYAEYSSEGMKGIQSMRALLGVADATSGLYSNMTMIMTFDSTADYLDRYEKSLAGIRQLAEETKSSALPVATTRRLKVGDADAIEVTMTLPNIAQNTPGAPDPQKFMKILAGPEGKLKIYVAPVDEHTVVMAYTSPDKLQAAIDFYKSKQAGLSGDPNVMKIAAALPAGSQLEVFVSPSGLMKIVQEVIGATPNAPPVKIPNFPDCPPVGMAAQISAAGVDGHTIVLADTLRAAGDMVAKTRASSRPPQ